MQFGGWCPAGHHEAHAKERGAWLSVGLALHRDETGSDELSSNQTFCAASWPKAERLLFAATCGENTLAAHEWGITDPNRDYAERYLSWLSLLPLRLNPVFTGRRSRAD